MLVEKDAKIANLNLVFGENEEPMLEYFDSFVYPAFSSGLTRKDNDVEYLFHGVGIEKDIRNEYVLVGKIVKKTILEIRSDIDANGILVEKDEKYSTAPYSTFAIYLKNHRMVLVPNQKGSPSLASFRSTTFSILSAYRKKINENLDDNHKIPEINLTVVGIPSAKGIKDLLYGVEKVNELKLRFYPLNGDIDFSGLFGSMTTELRQAVGSKRGETILKSPTKIDGIATILEEAGGTVEPIIQATTKEKAKVRFTETDISEKYKIKIDDQDDFERETQSVVRETQKLSAIEYTNDNHNSIYERNRGKIIKFVAKH